MKPSKQYVQIVQINNKTVHRPDTKLWNMEGQTSAGLINNLQFICLCHAHLEAIPLFVIYNGNASGHLGQYSSQKTRNSRERGPNARVLISVGYLAHGNIKCETKERSEHMNNYSYT